MTQAKTRASRMARAAGGGRLLLRATGRLIAPSGAAIDLEPKDALLLAYLAVEGPTPRVRLAELLWPDADEERARGNLRQRLLRLRRTTGIELVVGNPHAALAAGIGHDLDETCELLQGIASSQAGGLAEWLEAQRERRRRARIDWLDAACAQAEVEGDLAAALAHAEALVALDPTSEHAHRRVMKLHYLRGDAAAALAAYQRCRQTLERELNAAPSAETEALRNSVGSALVAPASAPARRAVPLSVLRPPRLIGREAEWAALQSAWDAAQPALVLGEAGLGKTRLVGDFAHAHGAVPVVAARPGDAQVVYALATRLLRQLPAEVTAALDAAVRKELARLLPEFGEAAPIGSEAERARFFNAVGAAVAAAAQRLDGLVIDDLHFADDASVELIRYVAASGPLRWLFAARPAEVGAQARELIEAMRRQSASTVIELAPLTLPQLAEFIDSLGIDGLTGAASAPALLRQTGGNPLFVLETIRNGLAQHAAADTAPALSAQRLPVAASMSSIVQRRIGRLSADAIKLARCAAVAGQDFSAELAAHVLGVRPLDLADAWAELEAAQVFRDGAFAHDLIYEAALASVPPPIARTLHAGIAEELTRRKGSPAAVAHHWIAAGDRGRAIAPLRQAAEQAIAAGRMSEAAEFFRLIAEACAALGDHDGQWRAMLERFECLFHVVGADELDELMQALLACARNDAQRAAAFQQRARLALTRIDLQGTREDALRAIELARNAGDPSLECEARLTLAQAMLRRRCPEEAAAALAAVQDWVQAEGSPSLRLLFAQCKAWLSIEMERFGQAWEQWVECARMSRELGDLPNVAVALSYQMLCLGYRGDFAGAATAGERARALLVEHALLGDPYPTIDSNLAHVYTWMGRYADALAAADRAEAVKTDPGTLALRRGIVFLLLGQPARARPLIEQSASLAQAPMLRLPAQLWLARALRATGRDAATARRVEDLLSEAAAVAKQSTKTGPLARVHVVRAELAGDDTRLASAREAVELVRGTESFGLSIAAHIRLADALLASGHPRDAVAAVELALALAESFLPENMTIPDMLLTAHRVFSAVRDSRARGVAERAVNWIYTTAGTHVPPEFRDSFLHRNPVNRELLTLATRLK